MESYEAYASYTDVMEMVESLVHHLCALVHGTGTVTYDGEEIDLTPPWQRLSLIDAVREWSGIDLLNDEMRTAEGLRGAMRERGLTPAADSSWPQLVDKLIGDLVEPRLIQPTFLVDYPIEMTPLAKTTERDPRLVERFEGFIGGMEVANSFTELNDPIEQAARLRAQEENREQFSDEDFDRLDEDFHNRGGARDAAGGWARSGHRPGGDDPDGTDDDSRGSAVPAAAHVGVSTPRRHLTLPHNEEG